MPDTLSHMLPLLFADVAVFDGEQLLAHQDVLVVEQRVAALGPTGTLDLEAEHETVRCEGCTLLPGLVDCHVHLDMDGGPPWTRSLANPREVAREWAQQGVTTLVVARGGRHVSRLAERIERGRVEGSHLVVAGTAITAPGGHPIPLLQAALPDLLDPAVRWVQNEAGTEERARRLVRRIHRRQEPPLFKVFYDAFPEGTPKLERSVMEAAVAEARALGMRPVVHAGSAQDAVEAAEAGAVLLMHAPFDTRLTPERAARLAELDVAFVPTLRAFGFPTEIMAERGPDPLELRWNPDRVEAFAHPPRRWDRHPMKEWMTRFEPRVEHGRANTLMLLEAGVPWLAGTDGGVPELFPGTALHVELERMAELGLSPAEVLAGATSRPGAWLQPEGGVGRIAPGQRADLLLVHGDPTEDLAALHEVEGVWVSGDRLR